MNTVELFRALDAVNGPSMSEQELRSLTEMTVDALGDHTELWDQFYALVAMHPAAAVRLVGLECAGARRGSDSARTSLVCWLLHDPHDLVAMLAASIAVRQTLRAAVPELFAALGNSRAGLKRMVSVRTDLRQDLMAAALTTLLETADNRVALERSLLSTGYDRAQEASHVIVDVEDMVGVPGTDLLVDAAPVTVSRYEAFLRAVDEVGHAWCHWGEPMSYGHQPCGLGQPEAPRSGAVTGVSWFDAFAFAGWAGKRLPTSTQWRQAVAPASEGATRTSVPVSVGVDASFDMLDECLRLLLHGSAVETAPGTEQWEWTSSRHLDNAELNPFVGRRDHFQTIGDWTMYAVVHGGMVLSSRVRPDPSYRGRKHVLHKSQEVSFRCVADRRDG
ncbi:formylglycine-generating enzyme family protein [Streptomyces sp. NPDC057638]|uniref:formylglycine-generating enzyme family protein n=1 Tax=Streptomyces sp. NPDC057638 TaxID=3346190 RepID=UPI00367E19F0